MDGPVEKKTEISSFFFFNRSFGLAFDFLSRWDECWMGWMLRRLLPVTLAFTKVQQPTSLRPFSLSSPPCLLQSPSWILKYKVARRRPFFLHSASITTSLDPPPPNVTHQDYGGQKRQDESQGQEDDASASALASASAAPAAGRRPIPRRRRPRPRPPP